MTFSKTSFFPSTIKEWNKLDPDIRNSDSFAIFKSKLLKCIRPCANSVINPIQDGGGDQKGPPTSFYPVTSTKVGISNQNF